ncbi:MAG: sigma-70 family RNA polymerase sigma factor [Alphaproteobacteria bacterium]|nr:sigma-70 family RNA polymerase sigma factor [Alphaproteobacteria bacterium]
MTDLETTFAACHGRLQGLAYRMLGSRADAEDVLQDAYLRVTEADQRAIRNPEAFLFTTVTRLCLDQLKSARARREVYVGPWLPEPVLDTEGLSPDSAAEIADDLSFALLLTLEKLSAPERAAFLLHDVFDAPYAQVADALGKSEAACRQLAARARKAVRSERPARPAPPEAHETLLAKFAEAITTGDPSRLEALLAADVVAYSDGGGVKIAARKPIRGAENVARFFIGLVRKHRARGGTSSFALAKINGAPGFIVHVDGALDQTLSIDVQNGRIAAFYIVRNPEKLRSIAAGPTEHSST